MKSKLLESKSQNEFGHRIYTSKQGHRLFTDEITENKIHYIKHLLQS